LRKPKFQACPEQWEKDAFWQELPLTDEQVLHIHCSSVRCKLRLSDSQLPNRTVLQNLGRIRIVSLAFKAPTFKQKCAKLLQVSHPTVGFSGSGGAGKTPSPTQTFAGSRRILGAAKPLSAANDVGCVTALTQLDSGQISLSIRAM